jgi:hypothetical protein
MAYGYEITQEDIDGVVRALKFTHPSYANDEVARIALEFNQDIVHDLAEADPELAERVAKVLKEQSKKRAQKWAAH